MKRPMNNGSGIGNGQTLAGFDLLALLDALAERVAARIQTHTATRRSPRLLTIDAAAEYLGRSRHSIDHMVRSGKLPSVRADRKIFLDRRDLDRWIEQNKVNADGV